MRDDEKSEKINTRIGKTFRADTNKHNSEKIESIMQDILIKNRVFYLKLTNEIVVLDR